MNAEAVLERSRRFGYGGDKPPFFFFCPQLGQFDLGSLFAGRAPFFGGGWCRGPVSGGRAAEPAADKTKVIKLGNKGTDARFFLDLRAVPS